MNANSTVWKKTITMLGSVDINCIIVWAGWWNDNLTIKYADSPETWAKFIQTAKSIDPNFVVLALVYGDRIDISTPNNRATMLESVKQLLVSVPFDGINDDLESFRGTTEDLINFWQAEASMVAGMGKMATVDLGVDWVLPYKIEDVYPYLSNFNYVMPMFYWTIKEPNALGYWNRILNNSAVSVIMGLDVDQSQMNFPLSEQLSWINQTMASNPHENLAGFAIWAYDYWADPDGTSNDFLAWTDWVTNGSEPTIQPVPAPPTSPDHGASLPTNDDNSDPTVPNSQTPTNTPTIPEMSCWIAIAVIFGMGAILVALTKGYKNTSMREKGKRKQKIVFRTIVVQSS